MQLNKSRSHSVEDKRIRNLYIKKQTNKNKSELAKPASIFIELKCFQCKLFFSGHGEHWNTMEVLDLNYNNLKGLSKKKNLWPYFST